jgi:hypothetical protein
MKERGNSPRGPNRSRRKPNSIAAQRERALTVLLWMYPFVLVLVLVMLFLQGFRAWGFALPENVIYVLVAEVIVEIASFIYIILRFLFPPEKK